MKKRLLIGLLSCTVISKMDAQTNFNSDMQVVQNNTGTNFNHHTAKITFSEPKQIGGDIGTVTINIEGTGTIRYYIKYSNKETDEEGVTTWYYIMNNQRELFNVVKFEKFYKPTFNKTYSYRFILDKYDRDGSLLYEHIYYCNK